MLLFVFFGRLTNERQQFYTYITKDHEILCLLIKVVNQSRIIQCNVVKEKKNFIYLFFTHVIISGILLQKYPFYNEFLIFFNGRLPFILTNESRFVDWKIGKRNIVANDTRRRSIYLSSTKFKLIINFILQIR